MEMDNNQKSNKKKISVPDELIRLNKYISNSGVCSRRDADELISAGHITVNGKKITRAAVSGHGMGNMVIALDLRRKYISF